MICSATAHLSGCAMPFPTPTAGAEVPRIPGTRHGKGGAHWDAPVRNSGLLDQLGEALPAFHGPLLHPRLHHALEVGVVLEAGGADHPGLAVDLVERQGLQYHVTGHALVLKGDHQALRCHTLAMP